MRNGKRAKAAPDLAERNPQTLSTVRLHSSDNSPTQRTNCFRSKLTMLGDAPASRTARITPPIAKKGEKS